MATKFKLNFMGSEILRSQYKLRIKFTEMNNLKNIISVRVVKSVPYLRSTKI